MTIDMDGICLGVGLVDSAWLLSARAFGVQGTERDHGSWGLLVWWYASCNGNSV